MGFNKWESEELSCSRQEAYLDVVLLNVEIYLGKLPSVFIMLACPAIQARPNEALFDV